MPTSRTYRLPWVELDLRQIEEAAGAVAAALPGVRCEVEARDPADVHCYFHVPREAASRLDGAELAHWFARPSPPPDPLPVEVVFQHLPPAPGDPTPTCLVGVNPGHSANGVCWETAKDILARLCRHWGDTCEEW